MASRGPLYALTYVWSCTMCHNLHDLHDIRDFHVLHGLYDLNGLLLRFALFLRELLGPKISGWRTNLSIWPLFSSLSILASKWWAHLYVDHIKHKKHKGVPQRPDEWSQKYKVGRMYIPNHGSWGWVAGPLVPKIQTLPKLGWPPPPSRHPEQFGPK